MMFKMEWLPSKDYLANGYGCWINQDGLILEVPFEHHSKVSDLCFGEYTGDAALYNGWIALTNYGGELAVMAIRTTSKSRSTAARLIRELGKNPSYVRLSNLHAMVESAAALAASLEDTRPVKLFTTMAAAVTSRDKLIQPAIRYAVLETAACEIPAHQNDYLVERVEITLPEANSNTIHAPADDAILDFGVRHYGKTELILHNDHGAGRSTAIQKAYEVLFKHEDDFKSYINRPFYDMLMDRARARGML